jgi:hypothetical protein
MDSRKFSLHEDSCSGDRTALTIAASRGGRSRNSGAAARNASLVITNGILITVDGGRRILNPGAVAIANRIVAVVDTPAAIASRYKAAQTSSTGGS